jgi:phosphoserine phosphatase RsbU/P
MEWLRQREANMPFLNFVAGPREGMFIDLRSDAIVLGRNPDCDVVLETQCVSRRHAVISNIAGTFHIEDTASRNGTSLNGKPLAGRTALQNGDDIRICEHGMCFSDTPTAHDPQDAMVDTLTTGLARILSSSELLPRIVDSALAMFPHADGGVLLLLEEDGLVAKSSRNSADRAARWGQEDARRVMDTGMATLSEGEWETPYDTPTNAMMSVPLTVPGHRAPMGVIQLTTRTGHSFTADDLRLLLTLAGHAARALENADITSFVAVRTTS